MQAKDIMSTGIITIRLSTLIREAVQLCVDHKVSGLIVVDDNEDIIGVLSEKDLLVAFDFLGESTTSIREFMSKEVVGIEEGTSIEEISRILVQRNFKRVPVLKGKKVVP